MTMLNLQSLLSKAYNFICRVTLPKFRKQNGRILIQFPRRIANPDFIEIGANVFLGAGSVLAACTKFHSQRATAAYSPLICIGNNVSATTALQIYSAHSVIIEDDVLLASNVFVCDYSHGISSVDAPFKDQPYENISPVRIGAGSWLGQNVVVMPGVSIGRFCVIGANSVVRNSIPDYSMAVGAPAKVVKVYDRELGGWRHA